MPQGQTRLVRSWGNVARGEHSVYSLGSRFDEFPRLPAQTSILPFGNGRSYGDSCLNVGGALLDMRSLDRFIQFDARHGTLRCEAGVQLGEILRIVAPAGWLPCVLPGTQYVTVGGAIANDVHGKNHHRAGSFGCHVTQFELLRSNGERLLCSPQMNPDWFAATIGGLGLTGVVTWAELQLTRVSGPWMSVESVRCRDLSELLEMSRAASQEHAYTVAWVDCAARRKRIGRGILQWADSADEVGETPPADRWCRLAVPFTPPISLLNSATMHVFNALHYRRHGGRVRSMQHYRQFFFPLDGIRHWNRLYGPRGFYQYQCVVPADGADASIRRLLRAIAASSEDSCLAVLKYFGDSVSPGLLSFPRCGVTLALDFPNRGARLESLFARLDAIVADAGGCLYPAKDARMPPSLFRAGFPQCETFSRFIDARCSSSFWRRVMAEA